jgi:ATP-dependent DNA ligase
VVVKTTYFEGDGEIVFKHACKLGCEGIAWKRSRCLTVTREAEENWT